MDQDEVKLLLDNLERELKRLRMEYNRYLAKAPDVQLEFAEQRVKDLIKLLQRAAFKKYIHKFRFENLTARYNVMRINFNRMAGIQEKKLARVKERLGMEGERTPAPEGTSPVEAGRSPAEVIRMKQEGGHEKELETFYSRYVELKTLHEGLVTLSFEEFERKISARRNQARKQGKAGELELKLVEEDGKVKIKTKVIK